MKTILLYSFSLVFLLFSCKKDSLEPDVIYALDKVKKDVPYGDHPLHVMDVYFPEGYNESSPVVFLIHGGGFIAGTKEEFSQTAELFMARGYITVNLSHRLVEAEGIDQTPPAHKKSAVVVRDQVKDIEIAVEKIKENADSWGIGTDKMYMAGHSAGGTLAMLYVQGKTNAGVRASGNFAGLANVTLPEEYYTNPPDHEYWPVVKELLYRMTGQEVEADQALALMAISPNWVTHSNKPGKPNITVMAKSNDKDLRFEPYFNSVKDAENYHKELKSNGVKSEYVVMDTDHGFGNHEDDWEKAVNHVVRFFKNN